MMLSKNDSFGFQTGLFKKNIEFDKLDITSIIQNISEIYNEMNNVINKLHEIISDTEYSFIEVEFYDMIKHWNELVEKRKMLITQITNKQDISCEYTTQLCTLSKLNAERNILIQEIVNFVSIPFKLKQNELEDEIKALKIENSRLNSIISESSINAINYMRVKDEEYDELRVKYNDLVKQKS